MESCTSVQSASIDSEESIEKKSVEEAENTSNNDDKQNDLTDLFTATVDLPKETSSSQNQSKVPTKKHVSQTFIVKKVGKDSKSHRFNSLTYKIKPVIRNSLVKSIFPRIYMGAPMITNPEDMNESTFEAKNGVNVLDDLPTKSKKRTNKINGFSNRIPNISVPLSFQQEVGKSNGLSGSVTTSPFQMTARTVPSAVISTTVSTAISTDTTTSKLSVKSQTPTIVFPKCTENQKAHRYVVPKPTHYISFPQSKTAISSSSSSIPISLTGPLVSSTLSFHNSTKTVQINSIPLMKVKLVSTPINSNGMPVAVQKKTKDKSNPSNATSPEKVINGIKLGKKSKNYSEKLSELVQKMKNETSGVPRTDMASDSDSIPAENRLKRKISKDANVNEPLNKRLRVGVEIKFDDGIKHFVSNLKDMTHVDDEPIKSWADLKKGQKVAAKWKDGLTYDAKVVSCYFPTDFKQMQPVVNLDKRCDQSPGAQENEKKLLSQQINKNKPSKIMCSACKLYFSKITYFRKHQREICKSPGVTVWCDKSPSKDKTIVTGNKKPVKDKTATSARTDPDLTRKKKDHNNKSKEISPRKRPFKPPLSSSGQYLFRKGTKFLHRWQLEDGSSKWYQGEIKKVVSSKHDENCEFQVVYKGEEDDGCYAVKLYEDYPNDIRIMGRS